MEELWYLNSAIDVMLDTPGVTVGSVGTAAEAVVGKVMEVVGTADALVAARDGHIRQQA